MASSSATTGSAASSVHEAPSIWLWAAIFVSLAAVAGSLYLSIGMGLRACPLCYYQRTFVMGAAAILTLGLFVSDLRPSVLTLLALPLSAAGLGVAGYHEFLVRTDVLECPLGVLEVGTAPQQSLVALAALTVLLMIDQLRRGALPTAAAALILGGLLAFGGIRSTASACPDYGKPLNEDMCRAPKKA